jgi:hypothetical protein
MNGDTQVNPIQIQQYLGGIDYPADKNDLIAKARDNGAPDDVIRNLENLPEEEQFEAPADVTLALEDLNEDMEEAEEI